MFKHIHTRPRNFLILLFVFVAVSGPLAVGLSHNSLLLLHATQRSTKVACLASAAVWSVA